MTIYYGQFSVCFFYTKPQNCGAILVTIRTVKVTIRFL